MMGTAQMVSLMGMPMPAPQKVQGMPPVPQPMSFGQQNFQPSAKPNIYSTGMYNMNPNQPLPDEKPKDFASMMSQIEKDSIQKK